MKTPTFDQYHLDTWIWGQEKILWGYNPDHKYTLKVLCPKRGRSGCLSLQYHHEKSESWVVLQGVAWAMIVIDSTVCTRIMRPGEVQTLAAGAIHRITAVSDDLQVLEASTPDRHAADKSQPKDVVRLHCVLGREVQAPQNKQQETLVNECIRITEEALATIDRGELPNEVNREKLEGHGIYSLYS